MGLEKPRTSKPQPIQVTTRPPHPPIRAGIIRLMSEMYQSKRERWNRLRENLPPGLREHVSLRNVEGVAGLPPEAQARLAQAIQAGLKRLPGAIEQLRRDPDTPVVTLLEPQPAASPQLPAASAEFRKELADLIQACYPDMPRLSAEALAEAEALRVVGEVAEALQGLFASSHLQVDFVLAVAYALLERAVARLATLIAGTPAARQVAHIPSHWRKQDA